MDNAPTQLPPAESPQKPPPQPRLRPGPIIRDVSIIFLLTYLGGFVARLAANGAPPDAEHVQLAIAASNIFFGTVGFTIAGCVATSGRWRHLGAVAVGAWLAGLINVAFYGVTFPRWFASILLITLIMGLGGAISYVFKRDLHPPG